MRVTSAPRRQAARASASARRHDYFLSPQRRLSFEQPSDVTHDYVRLRHPTGSTALTHRQRTFVRLQNLITKRSRVGHVTLRLRMGPHAVVHRGNEQNFGLGGKQAGGEEIVR